MATPDFIKNIGNTVLDAGKAKLAAMSDQAIPAVLGVVNATPAAPAASERVGTTATGAAIVEKPQAQPNQRPAWLLPAAAAGSVLVVGLIIFLIMRKKR